MNRIGITGSRSLTNQILLNRSLYKLLEEEHLTPQNTVFCTGIASGIDTNATTFLQDQGYVVIQFKSIYKYHQDLYHIIPRQWRNFMYLCKDMNMVDNIDRLWIYWDGYSQGTKNTVTYAKEKEIPFRYCNYVKFF